MKKLICMVVMFVSLVVTVESKATWVKIDDFESGSFGSDWTVVQGAAISDDLIAGTTNKVLQMTCENYGTAIKRAINRNTALQIGSAATKTVYLRMGTGADPYQSRCTYGMSRYTAPTGASSYETIAKINYGSDLITRDGPTSYTDFPAGSSLLGRGVWLQMWMVINNATDTYQLYILGGNYTSQTQVTYSGDGDFKFRNGTTSTLISLAFLNDLESSQNANKYVLYDDIYVSEGANLTNIPEPTTMILLGIGGLALVGRKK